MHPSAEKRFINVNRYTIIVLFMVIAAGGIVRSTGSGMGCPDWPKCFNQIIPPTDVSQLPEGYEQHYIEGRQKKNERFANLVEMFGYHGKASQIRNDESILVHEEFNVAKTWTEYLNRLVGVLAGFFLLFTAIFSLHYKRVKPTIVVWSVLNLIFVIIQAWLGSIVVSTNLTPWIITVHMLLALVIVAVSIYTYMLAIRLRQGDALQMRSTSTIKGLAIFSILVTVVQVVFGTAVRENIDHLNDASVPRVDWIESLGADLHWHRVLAYFSCILIVLLFVLIKRHFAKATQPHRYGWIVLILVASQMLVGILLNEFNVPAFAQTAHLILASLLFGAQFYLMLLLSKTKKLA